MLTALASVAAWPWSKPPPPPPTPPQSASLLPTALAVLSCWVVPALLYHAGKQPKPVAGKEERAQQAVTKPVNHGVLIASLLTGGKAPREGEGEATAPREEDELHCPATQVAPPQRPRRAPAARAPALRG